MILANLEHAQITQLANTTLENGAAIENRALGLCTSLHLNVEHINAVMIYPNAKLTQRLGQLLVSASKLGCGFST